MLAPALSAQSEGQAAEDIDQLFIEAMQALENDDLRTARKRFQNLLSRNPALHRARLELARVYYLSLDYENARLETQRVLDDPNTPAQVRVTLLAFLAQIDADRIELEKRHRWGGSLYLGAIYDSNVNVGPDQEIVELDGTRFFLSDASREQSDLGVSAIAGLTHSYTPGITFSFGENSGFFLWQSQANINYRHYLDQDDFSLGVLSLRSGPSWIVPRHWQAGIAIQLDQIWLGADSLALFSSLNPNIVWQIGDAWSLGLNAVYTRRDYDALENRQRDGDYMSLNLTLARYFSERDLSVQGGVGYSSFDARAEHFSHSGPDAFIGLSANPWKHSSVYARLNWRSYDFDGTQPFVGRSRDDDELRYSVGYEYDLQSGWLQGWQLLASASYTDNSSNIAIFDYGRLQFRLGVSRPF